MFALVGSWLTALGVSLTSTVASFGTGIIATLIAYFSTWKAAIYACFVLLISIELYNLFVDVIEEILNWVTSILNGLSAPDGMPSAGIQVANLAGYLAYHLKIPQCISFIFNAIMLKWLLRKVPLLNW